jgi:hypothetical protein
LLILPSSAGGEGRGEGYVIDFDVAMMWFKLKMVLFLNVKYIYLYISFHLQYIRNYKYS